MQDIEIKILEYFKKNPIKGFSTTDLVKAIFSAEYSEIRHMLDSTDKKRQNIAKRNKARLHRKLLYHLNKLISEKFIQLKDVHGKGEKIFSLALTEGETEINIKGKKIIIHKPSSIITPIDNYEKDGLVRKFRPENWLTKMNSVLIEADAFQDINDIEITIQNILSNINDALCINSFEKFIEEENHKDTEEFITKMSELLTDYNIQMALIINLAEVRREGQIINFFNFFSVLKPKNISIIINATDKTLNENTRVMQRVIDLFSKERIKINIKNNNIHTAPIFMGNAGAYTITEKDWQEYLAKTKFRTKGICVTQASIAIDVKRVFEKYKSASDFRKIVLKCVKSLFFAKTEKRKSSDSIFLPIHAMNKGYEKHFFKYSNNYVRFWNYDENIDEDTTMLDILESSKRSAEEFSKTQERVYLSCGIPIRFKVQFSSAFYKFDEDFLSDRRYKKTAIFSLKDLKTQKIQSYLKFRENLLSVMDRCDRVRIFRGKPVESREVIKEFTFLMNNFRIPLITYDFSRVKGEVTLTNFI